MPTVMPKLITPLIRKFCLKINPKEHPIFAPIHPEIGSLENDCFFNVRPKIEREGGSIANGWRIAIWPSVFIEAEHHAVWQSPTGALIDVPDYPSYASAAMSR
jgi:hypothetical protein